MTNLVGKMTASEGRNEMGFVVRDENVTSWFEINTSDGRIRVVRQMDREKAETIRLAIRAEDVAAATTGQTASGRTNPLQRLYDSNLVIIIRLQEHWRSFWKTLTITTLYSINRFIVDPYRRIVNVERLF